MSKSVFVQFGLRPGDSNQIAAIESTQLRPSSVFTNPKWSQRSLGRVMAETPEFRFVLVRFGISSRRLRSAESVNPSSEVAKKWPRNFYDETYKSFVIRFVNK
ncbi:hypothetical protein J6590_080697 [Homalodisca vitripennis]|nr:hypothetical protein J6590_080697 [Homalodisca vitripennis]